MKTLRNLFDLTNRLGGSRFDRYYSEILKTGSGYPTADEARRDLQRYDRTNQPYGWFR